MLHSLSGAVSSPPTSCVVQGMSLGKGTGYSSLYTPCKPLKALGPNTLPFFQVSVMPMSPMLVCTTTAEQLRGRFTGLTHLCSMAGHSGFQNDKTEGKM